MLHLDLATVGSLAAFTFTADAIKRHGAVPSVEFSHSGQYAGTYMADKDKKQGLTQYGPSDGVRPDGRKVTALTKEQIADIVKRYGETAILAKRAGFEMIMVHGGHTWLLNQFMSPFFQPPDRRVRRKLREPHALYYRGTSGSEKGRRSHVPD